MSSPQISNAHVDMKLEVVVIPVSDVDRAKRFYEGLGWRLDADFAGDDWRAVQLTPPGSPCSIHFGKGVTTAAPGSVQGLFLVVDDIEAARAELIAKGADVASTNPPRRSTTGRRGTPPTSLRASEGRRPRKPPRMARSTSKAQGDEGRHRSRCSLPRLRAFGRTQGADVRRTGLIRRSEAIALPTPTSTP
jgi:catechol 2,3-dioxygenase-like lactoylglutathione lyase family enzyme